MAEVTVSAGALTQRRLATTGKQVLGHEEIMAYGDTTLADVLRRLPGITVDAAPGNEQRSTIRMHGLGDGYTLVMLNGVPAPAGFSFDSLAPALVERVEVLRAATAESGSQAIAGTIKIVLKKTVAPRQREVTLGESTLNGRRSANLAASLSGREGAISYVMAATAERKRSATPSAWLEESGGADGQLTTVRASAQQEVPLSDNVDLAPRLSWALPGGDTLSWQGYAGYKHMDNYHLYDETVLLGASTGFPDSRATYTGRSAVLRSDLDWVRKLGGGGSLDITLAASGSWRDANFHFYGADAAGNNAGRHDVASGPGERGYQLKGTYRAPLGASHALALGWDGSARSRSEYRRESSVDGDGQLLSSTDEHYDATVRQLALFAQDDWDISAQWSMYAGVRWAGMATSSKGNVLAQVDQRSSVWSPLLHVLWKLPAAQNAPGRGGSDQVRLALTRTYKAPTIAQLIPRRYATDNNNSPVNPDTQGNPALRPELAWGFDAAYEHYPAGGGLFSASVNLRRIADVTLDTLFQSAGRWVSMPENGGNATTRGVELELKHPLSAGLELKANLARNWSRVDGVAGPDNRLDRQAPASANLGLDYGKPSARLNMGVNLGYTGAAPVRQSALLWYDSSPKRAFDLYAAWKIREGLRWKLSAANLFSHDSVEIRRFIGNTTGVAGWLRQTVRTPASATVRLVLELQL
jgi:outer membrane receptor protein involved in Fe transport